MHIDVSHTNLSKYGNTIFTFYPVTITNSDGIYFKFETQKSRVKGASQVCHSVVNESRSYNQIKRKYFDIRYLL